MSSKRTSKVQRWMRNRPGQSLVEFALLSPMLLLLFFGLVEFARAWNIRHTLTDAAREGARTLVVDNADYTQAYATQVIHTALASAGIDTTSAEILLDEGGNTRGNPSTVAIRYDYTLGIVRAFLGWALPDATLTISTTFTMRNE